jgi:hypothetical protein
MESWRAHENPGLYRFDPDQVMWYRTDEHRFAGFSDITVFHPDRLRRAGWDPGHVEKHAAARAMAMFGPMALTPYPFVAFLPYPHTPRRGFRYRLKQPKRFRRPACIRVMSPAEAEAFMQRNPSRLPFASEYLSLESPLRQRLIGADWVH